MPQIIKRIPVLALTATALALVTQVNGVAAQSRSNESRNMLTQRCVQQAQQAVPDSSVAGSHRQRENLYRSCMREGGARRG